MADVKVILQKDVPNLGHAGDVKQVKPGYFRNYLLPRGLAVEASKGNISALQSSSAVRSAQATRAKDQMSALARRIGEISLRIPVRLGEQGRIYGSVTNRDIAEALTEQASLTIDRHQIELPEPLKAIGEHTVPIKLEHGAEAQLRVDLVPEGEPAGA